MKKLLVMLGVLALTLLLSGCDYEQSQTTYAIKDYEYCVLRGDDVLFGGVDRVECDDDEYTYEEYKEIKEYETSFLTQEEIDLLILNLMDTFNAELDSRYTQEEVDAIIADLKLRTTNEIDWLWIAMDDTYTKDEIDEGFEEFRIALFEKHPEFDDLLNWRFNFTKQLMEIFIFEDESHTNYVVISIEAVEDIFEVEVYFVEDYTIVYRVPQEDLGVDQFHGVDLYGYTMLILASFVEHDASYESILEEVGPIDE